MKVIMTLLDLHYFKQGLLSVCYEKEPAYVDFPTREYLIMKEEVVKPLEGGRYLIQKKI